MVFLCTGCFAVCAAAFGVKVATAVIQPCTVASEGVFEAHNIRVLHWGAINCVPGVDQETYVVVSQPVVSYHRAG